MYKATASLFPISGRILGLSSRELRPNIPASILVQCHSPVHMLACHRYLQLLISHLRPLFYRKDLSLGGASRIRGGIGQGKRHKFFSHCLLPCSRTIMWAVLYIRYCYCRPTLQEMTPRLSLPNSNLSVQSQACGLYPAGPYPIFLEKLLPSLHDLAQEKQMLCVYLAAQGTNLLCQSRC